MLAVAAAIGQIVESMCGKSEYLVLPGPFDRQITQVRDPQAVRQMPIDCGFDEIGRKESQRYRHVGFARCICAMLTQARPLRSRERRTTGNLSGTLGIESKRMLILRPS